jgi:diguanylate cyclase (GGDEF)-like protein
MPARNSIRIGEALLAFLTPRYDPFVVAVSILIAGFASYVAFDLAKRVRTHDRHVALAWWLCGSLALGTGIWAMHFVGMLAFSLPIAIGYDMALTLASWLAGAAVSAVALCVAGRGSMTWRRVAVGAPLMAAGICAMHYLGMAALVMTPGIVWNPLLVAGSAVIALCASAAALPLFAWTRELNERRGVLGQLLAALVMGLAISGMHYTGMAAAQFPIGSVCLSAGSLAGDSLGMLVAVVSASLLALTLTMSIFDARLQSRSAALAKSLSIANSKLQSVNEELKRQAFVDPLTGLPNRLLFEDRLLHAVRRSERAEERISERKQPRLAVLFIDLDGFKPVNDSFGHAAGDAVLREAAHRLRRTARDTDTVARVGGDEFVMLMEDVGSVADAVTLARRLNEALAQAYSIPDRQVEITGSIGIVVYPDQGHRDKLMANADVAMYAAKRAGGGSYAMFESHMDAGASEQLSLQNDLRHAIELGQLQLFYQPKVDGRLGQIRGVEALLRWNHAQRGMVSPAVFIPIAERFGLIGAIGNWVIEDACRQSRQWREKGVRMRVAINLSAHQMRQDDIVERITGALQAHKIHPSLLTCEITESAAMEDTKTTQTTFRRLGELGTHMSIDDFGTGYSSLSYLRKLPAEELKIDRSFIQDLEHSADARAVVDAVIKLAHALGLKVVAEGVENQRQQQVLVQMGVDELQGFLFAKPMTARALLLWAMDDHREHETAFASSLFVSTVRAQLGEPITHALH